MDVNILHYYDMQLSATVITCTVHSDQKNTIAMHYLFKIYAHKWQYKYRSTVMFAGLQTVTIKKLVKK